VIRHSCWRGIGDHRASGVVGRCCGLGAWLDFPAVDSPRAWDDLGCIAATSVAGAPGSAGWGWFRLQRNFAACPRFWNTAAPEGRPTKCPRPLVDGWFAAEGVIAGSSSGSVSRRVRREELTAATRANRETRRHRDGPPEVSSQIFGGKQGVCGRVTWIERTEAGGRVKIFGGAGYVRTSD
jgi:hypothetical protein